MSAGPTRTAGPVSEASRWRLELAREISAIHAARSGVSWIGVAGSVARGTADAWSDLDILVCWEEPDPEWLEDPPLARLGANRFLYAPTDAEGSRLEQYFLGDLKVDVAHPVRRSLEQTIRDVVEGCSTDSRKQKTLATLADCLALHGEAELSAIHAQLARYPEELARKTIVAHLFFFPIWAPRDLSLERGDLVGFYDYMNRAVRNLMGLLAGLNRLYYSSEGEQKGTLHLIERMKINPPDLRRRIDEALARPSRASIERFYELVGEVLGLVEEHGPAIDVSGARALLALPLRACNERPRPGPATPRS